MHYWKLMAGKGSQYVDMFVENKRIAIGFSFTDKVSDAKSVEEVRQIVSEEHIDARSGQVIAWGSMLYKFYHDMQEGDRVLVYDPGTRLYHVGKVDSEVEFVEGEELPHTRRIEWEGTVSRDDLSSGTRNMLGAILTLFEISQEPQIEIERVLEGKCNEAVVEGEEVDDLGADVYERSQEFVKDAIVKLSWDDMQELVAGLLRAMGYKTRVSGLGADRGKDIIASPDGLGLEDPRIHVEVKHRPNTQMGTDAIRSFAGGLRNTKGVYVSTGGFSKEAYYEAERAQEPVRLVDIDELASLITQYYDTFDSEARALIPLRKLYWPLR